MGAPDIIAPLIVAPESVIIIDHSDACGLKKGQMAVPYAGSANRPFLFVPVFPLAIMEFYFIFTIELRTSLTLL